MQGRVDRCQHGAPRRLPPLASWRRWRLRQAHSSLETMEVATMLVLAGGTALLGSWAAWAGAQESRAKEEHLRACLQPRTIEREV